MMVHDSWFMVKGLTTQAAPMASLGVVVKTLFTQTKRTGISPCPLLVVYSSSSKLEEGDHLWWRSMKLLVHFNAPEYTYISPAHPEYLRHVF